MTSGSETESNEQTTGRPDAESIRPSGDPSPKRRFYEQVTPAFVRERFATKFVLTLLLVVVVMGAIGVVTYVQIQEDIERDATSTLESTAELQSTGVSEWVDEMRSQTSMIANPEIRPEDSETMNSYLESAKEGGAPSIVGVHYVDVDAETVVASTSTSYREQNLEGVDEPWGEPTSGLYERSADGVAVTDRSYEHGDGIALAFVAPAGERGWIVLTTRPGREFTHLGTTENGVTTHLLTSQGGTVLEASEGETLADTDAFDAAVDGQMRTVEIGPDVRTYRPVDGTDWVAVSAAEKSTLYSVSDTVGRNVIVLIGAGLLSVLVVGLTLGRVTVAPLVQLRERTRAIEEGDLEVDLSTRREDEIGSLYAAFASMRDALAKQFREAERAKHEAESSHEEMERQNRRLDEFASTLSHDLRNPLAVARGHVELLNTKTDDGNEDLRKHVTKIDGAHERIDSIINDVLTLTRKGESVEETERFELGDVAREAWSNIDSKDGSLTVRKSIAIEGDRSRLLRAFENLFRNSLDHGPNDVSVTVGLTEDGFYVQDDGPGIPDEELDEIFEYGHTTSDDGTGLGLSIVKTIAEAHGWSLWIDGTYEAGARFVFADVFASEERIFEESAFTWDHAAG